MRLPTIGNASRPFFPAAYAAMPLKNMRVKYIQKIIQTYFIVYYFFWGNHPDVCWLVISSDIRWQKFDKQTIRYFSCKYLDLYNYAKSKLHLCYCNILHVMARKRSGCNTFWSLYQNIHFLITVCICWMCISVSQIKKYRLLWFTNDW